VEGAAGVTEEAHAAAEHIDREPPIAFFLSAESFLKTAIHAHEAMASRTLKLRFDMPVYYLYSHAIELTLKAFLRARGIEAKELAKGGKRGKWGHDLRKLWAGCFERGLTMDLPTRLETGAVVDALAPYAETYEFRYVQVGFKTLPTLDVVREAAQALRAAVRPTVTATVSGSIPEREAR
jgi:hypothetical protein